MCRVNMIASLDLSHLQRTPRVICKINYAWYVASYILCPSPCNNAPHRLVTAIDVCDIYVPSSTLRNVTYIIDAHS